ncbi:MAG: DUF445 family protein, partial [Victivallaceae bacterium]|nr:DUF445 family protein [Victivallaceae bacterium]
DVCGAGWAKLADKLGEELNGLLHEYLAAELPGMLSEILQRDELWRAVRETLLPLLQNYVDHYLRRGGSREIEKRLDLAGRVERSVNAMDVRKLHAMVNEVSGEELTAIQLLGFVLGGIAGAFLALAV